MNRTRLFVLILMFSLTDTAQALRVYSPDSVLSPAAPQDNYDYFFLEAMVQRQQGNDDAAFDLLRHCLQLNPEAPEVYYYLAQYYSALKDQDRSLEYVKRAAELDPDEPIFLETLAQLYIGKKEYDKATEAVEQLYAHHKDRDDLLETLFQLYQEQKRYDEAIHTLELLENIGGKNERLSFAKSDIYTAMGNRKAAIHEMEALAKQYPNDLNYLGRYADMLLMNDQEKRAVEIYNRILNEEPDNVRAQASMLTYYQVQKDSTAVEEMTERLLTNKNTTPQQKTYLLRQKISENEDQGGDSTQILSLFRKLMKPQPLDIDIASLCVAYMDLKDMPHDSIRPVLEHILEAQPDNASARLQLVSFAWDEKDMDRIISLCKQARQYNPDEMAFYYYQGMAYYQKDEKDEALSAFQNGIGVINEDSNPNIVSDFYAVMGDLLHQKGMAQEAFAAYDSCLVWKDDNIMCLNNYAYYLSERGERLDQAEQMSEKTIKAEPKNATYLDTYAWILFMQQRYAEAKIYIEQALQNKEDSVDNSVILEHAGDICAQNGDTEHALQFWQEALSTRPEEKVLIRKIKLKKYVKE